MEVVTPNWIERLVMYAERPEIGAVGGRLWWQDGRLQHAGILFENGGYPGRALSAYRRALEWILGEDQEPLERAA